MSGINATPIYRTDLVLNNLRESKIILLKALCKLLQAAYAYYILTPNCSSDFG